MRSLLLSFIIYYVRAELQKILFCFAERHAGKIQETWNSRKKKYILIPLSRIDPKHWDVKKKTYWVLWVFFLLCGVWGRRREWKLGRMEKSMDADTAGLWKGGHWNSFHYTDCSLNRWTPLIFFLKCKGKIYLILSKKMFTVHILDNFWKKK